MKIISVVGARPNFMKIAPFIKSIEKHNAQSSEKIEHTLVHTGQHYDDRMSKSFFEQLGIPDADINLGIGSGSHATQVGNTMIEFEKVVKKIQPDWIVVVGDVNATLACSVTAKKEHVLCCHIEAGLRSGDIKMPEEVNRLVTDSICDLLLTPDTMSSQNLKHDGVSDNKIGFVGNIMIDTLENKRKEAEQLDIKTILTANCLESSKDKIKDLSFDNNYAIVTMHRPSNVDDKHILGSIVRFLIDEVSIKAPVIWTIHPRTKKMLIDFDLFDELEANKNFILLEPLGYIEMLKMNMNAKIILTDSGGLQEECTVLGTPCLTLRWNTERPITLKENGGASVLVGNNVDLIRKEFIEAMRKERKPIRPELWDGKTADRCLEEILNYKQ